MPEVPKENFTNFLNPPKMSPRFLQKDPGGSTAGHFAGYKKKKPLAGPHSPRGLRVPQTRKKFSLALRTGVKMGVLMCVFLADFGQKIQKLPKTGIFGSFLGVKNFPALPAESLRRNFPQPCQQTHPPAGSTRISTSQNCHGLPSCAVLRSGERLPTASGN